MTAKSGVSDWEGAFRAVLSRADFLALAARAAVPILPILGRVAAFCERACGRGGWLPPSPGLSSRRVFHNGRGVSSRGMRLALHLLLQPLEGLVDIVVADENLDAVFLFDRALATVAELAIRNHGVPWWVCDRIC